MTRIIWLLAILALLYSCRFGEPSRFEKVSASQSGIAFENRVIETDSINLGTNYYFYNGGGVAVADFNGDGLADVFLIGNHVPSRLYLNRGNLQFTDVTEAAGLLTHSWASGASFVDINGDNRQDLFVCTVRKGESNLFFINQGNDKDGVPHFRDRAQEMGLGEPLISTQAAFIDYDRDNDLDLFIAVNSQLMNHRNELKPRNTDFRDDTRDRLYRNNGPAALPNGEGLGGVSFTDVSKQTGITNEGYALGVAVNDLNNDGWADVYVSNDFLSNDLLYINNRHGGFEEKAVDYLRHASFNGMGVDVADVNRDGLMDVTVMDMLPPTNSRRKQMLAPVNYDVILYRKRLGYVPQHVRNTLQLNQGTDPAGNIQFSEVGALKNLYATDWSWAPLWADYDNDGRLDLYITNGYYKDLTDLDFSSGFQENLKFGTEAYSVNYQKDLLGKLNPIKSSNYFYHQNPDFTFTDQTQQAGLFEPSYSHGSAFADLDNDGDLDLVVNNLGQEAFLYRNTTRDNQKENPADNYLTIRLLGTGLNTNAIGSRVEITRGTVTQTEFHSTVRGYLSSMAETMHVGLGRATRADRITVTWPDGKRQSMSNVPANQRLTIRYQPDNQPLTSSEKSTSALAFRDVSDETGLNVAQTENEFIDFKNNVLLLKMYSREGPGIAVGDIDGDGLDDLAIGGAAGQPTTLLRQKNGRFVASKLPVDQQFEDMGLLFFDADGDGDDDLFVVSGGAELPDNSAGYEDRLYLNQNGTFRRAPLPPMRSSGGKVCAADVDRDGDLDLFVAGKVRPGSYPLPPESRLLLNTNGTFRDATPSQLRRVGMVNDALWTDFNNDGWPDLMLVGEWMDITFFVNKNGQLSPYTNTGLAPSEGWWNCLAGGDFDRDGDTDYLLGNFGLNSHIRAGQDHPVKVYATDFDQNGTIDPIVSYFSQNDEGELSEFPLHTRGALAEKVPAFKRRFSDYRSFASVKFSGVLRKDEWENAPVLQARNLRSSYMENLGNGQFRLRDLPADCQAAPVNAILPADVNGDGILDAILAGNLYTADPIFGNYDALSGVVLLGNGRGNFRSVPNRESQLYLTGDQKSLATLLVAGKPVLVSGANSARLKADRMPLPDGQIRRVAKLRPTDTYALVRFANGSRAKTEFYYGHTALSQSSRTFLITDQMRDIIVVDSRGKQRKL